MFKAIAVAALVASASFGLPADATNDAASSHKLIFDGPSQPVPGQFARYRAAPRGGLLSITPPDGAEFLKGQHFDLRIELHNECATGSKDACASPTLAGLKCTVNGADLPTYFGGKWPEVTETWNFTYTKTMEDLYKKNLTPVGVSSFVWRSLKFDTVGDVDFKCDTPGVAKRVKRDGTAQTVYGKWHVRSFADEGRKAKNVVLFVGDGMSVGMITAARALSQPTWYGKNFQNLLNMEKSGTSIGMVLTNGMDSMITDSANSAASYTTGHKGFVNALGVNGDTSPDTLDDPKIETMAEVLRRMRPDMCIGVVSTSEIQDATPASAFAHTRRRGDKAIITDQNITPLKNWNPKAVELDVLMGGGGAYFCSNSTSSKCRSLDGRDMYAEYAAKGYKIVHTGPELANYTRSDKVLGIFALNNLDTWIDRVVLNSNLGATNSSPTGQASTNYQQAGLELMVTKAIEVMEKRCSDGFFLLAEAASIDKSMHPQDYHRGLADLLEMDRAVKVAKDYSVKNGMNTLVMITADHSQAYDVVGSVDTQYLVSLPDEDASGSQFAKKQAIGTYDTAGFFDIVIDPATGLPTRWDGRFQPASGKVDGSERRENFTLVSKPTGTNPLTRSPAAKNDNKTTELGYTVYTANPRDGEHGIRQSGLLPGSGESSVHSMADVPLYCYGPGQGACGRVMDNTEVFYVIAQALGL